MKEIENGRNEEYAVTTTTEKEEERQLEREREI